MPELGVVTIVRQENTVLLTQREDFELWCLPGGAVDPQEAINAAAVREVYEETGVQIELTRLLGILSKPNWGQGGTHLSVFMGVPCGGTLRADPNEVCDLAYFPLDALPEPLMWEHQYLITVAQAGVTGYMWVNQAQMPPHLASRAALYAWRDNSGLSRQEAYAQFMAEVGPQTMAVILDPRGYPPSDIAQDRF